MTDPMPLDLDAVLHNPHTAATSEDTTEQTTAQQPPGKQEAGGLLDDFDLDLDPTGYAELVAWFADEHDQAAELMDQLHQHQDGTDGWAGDA